MAYPVVPDVPQGSLFENQALLESATLHAAGATTGAGTDFDVTGMSTAQLTIVPSSYTGTLTFTASADGTNFANILGHKQGVTTVAYASASPNSTAEIWAFEVAGLTKLRATMAGGSGSCAVYGSSSPFSNASAVAGTTGAVTVSAGAARMGTVTLGDGSTPTQLQAVDATGNAAVSLVKVGTNATPVGHGTAAAALRVELPTDSTGLISAKITDSAGTNQVTVDAQHAMKVASGGSLIASVTAQTAGAAAVVTGSGRLCRIITTSAATAGILFYDSTTQAAGTVIGAVPAGAAVGTMYSPELPFANGVYPAGAINTPACTVGYD